MLGPFYLFVVECKIKQFRDSHESDVIDDLVVVVVVVADDCKLFLKLYHWLKMLHLSRPVVPNWGAAKRCEVYRQILNCCLFIDVLINRVSQIVIFNPTGVPPNFFKT